VVASGVVAFGVVASVMVGYAFFASALDALGLVTFGLVDSVVVASGVVAFVVVASVMGHCQPVCQICLACVDFGTQASVWLCEDMEICFLTNFGWYNASLLQRYSVVDYKHF
jgi:hypothetical protein